MLKKAFDFFVFTSLFIACCAVLMVYQASLLFRLQLPHSLYLFVFFGSVCSYNFHWYLTPPDVSALSDKLRWNLSNKTLHLLLSATGFAGAAACAFLLVQNWFWLALTGLLTFLYSAPMIPHPAFMRLRRIAVAKTIYLAMAWTQVTALLPLVISPGPLQPVHTWYLVNRFLFLYAICIVFDRRDVESDRKAGIKSLVTYLSSRGVDRLFWCTLVLFAGTTVILCRWMPVADVVILAFPSLLLAFLHLPAKQSKSDYLYYFLLDGLMALSAPILILAKFAR